MVTLNPILRKISQIKLSQKENVKSHGLYYMQLNHHKRSSQAIQCILL